MVDKALSPIVGEIISEDAVYTLADFCRNCDMPADQIIEYVEAGVIEPSGRDPVKWRFSQTSVIRLRKAQRLQTDLGLNLAGLALALDLLDEIDRLKSHIHPVTEEWEG